MPGKLNRDQTTYAGTNAGTQYSLMHGPFENFGVFNGQFEQGPSGQLETDPPEGWLFISALDTGGVAQRVTGGYTGNWCLKGGNAAANKKGYRVEAQKYLPINGGEVYYAQCAMKADNSGAITWTILTYNAAKGALASVNLLSVSVLGAAWVMAWALIGPGYAATWPANVRYARLRFDLQTDATADNAWVYIDDVKFQQTQRWLLPQ